ncbi:hypothetical protein GTW40_30025 [Streptomyces sp. SID4985]|uniref:SMI1/KNR4 family protein n=1 Tax=Streptomyces sp. SID4985 TaxID=2690292 RepID=UPI00136BF3EA|nr:SMI1/KNR4 family protein [Streptomyces sp. SID4985]MYQ49208.1 hypothetical protein [Streptomyces sp. SID4985]
MSHPHPTRPLRHLAPLTALCPPPPGGGRNVEWPAAEGTLGVPLPADYKQLVRTYGGGLFGDLIWLLEPGCPEAMYDLVAQTTERKEWRRNPQGTGATPPPPAYRISARTIRHVVADGGWTPSFSAVRRMVASRAWVGR